MISQSRWDWLLGEVEYSFKVMIVDESTEMTEDEAKMVLNVLKNNTPFQVVPDCCLGKNPKKETIEAMNDDVILETNNVLLETQQCVIKDTKFKVLGDKG